MSNSNMVRTTNGSPIPQEIQWQSTKVVVAKNNQRKLHKVNKWLTVDTTNIQLNHHACLSYCCCCGGFERLPAVLYSQHAANCGLCELPAAAPPPHLSSFIMDSRQSEANNISGERNHALSIW